MGYKTLDEAIARAVKVTLGGDVAVLVEIETGRGDEKEYLVVREGYLDTDEFNAFNGRVIDEYYDGQPC